MSQIGTLVQTLAKGGPVMIPLLACSIVALAVVVERLAFWWRQGDPGSACARSSWPSAASSTRPSRWPVARRAHPLE